jgi:hypothetical protein
MPGAKTMVIPESEIKRLVYGMMPKEWINQFEKSNQHPGTGLMEYMTTKLDKVVIYSISLGSVVVVVPRCWFDVSIPEASCFKPIV